MRNWNRIYHQSKRITSYLKDSFTEAGEKGALLTPMERRIAEKLLRPGYMMKKRAEQKQFDADAAFARLKRRNNRRRMVWIGSVAASLILLLGLGMLIRSMSERETEVLVQNRTIAPGQHRATLKLADGRVVTLGDSVCSPIQTEEGILHVEAARVNCGEDTTVNNETTVAYNTLAIPRGGEYQLTLSDGTQVWLNSETELRFPVRFAGNERKVYLKGEAYFDVKKDSLKPFRVQTELGNIEVLGTAFNVSVYSDNEIAATLESGAISYNREGQKGVRIRPGEQLTYVRGQAEAEVRKVNTRLYTAWKDHLFCFEEQRLDRIMEILARWYDFQVVFDSEELRKLEFSGTLDKYSDIRPLLDLFSLGSRITFDIRGDTIVVKK